MEILKYSEYIPEGVKKMGTWSSAVCQLQIWNKVKENLYGKQKKQKIIQHYKYEAYVAFHLLVKNV